MTENPYQYNSPISYTGRFAGREGAFSFVQTNLVGGHQAHALVLLGPPQIGKSSVLRRLPMVIDSRYVPVRLSLRAGTVNGEKAWLTALAETVPQALADLDIQSARLPELPAQAADLREALQGEYMREGLRYLRRDRHLLILIDNADRLLTAVRSHELPRDSFKFLAEVLAAHTHLDIVMAFDSRYEEDLVSIGPPFDQTYFYRLGPLTPEEVQQMLTTPLGELVTYEPGALDAVYDLTAGQPYLAQLMGWLLFERSDAREHQTPITAADVEAVIEPALGMGADALGAVWHNGTPQEQLVLTALTALSPQEPPTPIPHDDISAWLVAADRELDPRTVNATWRRLDYEGVLRLTADGNLVINGGLQRRWLRSHVTLPDTGGSGVPWRRVILLAAAVVIVLGLVLAILTSLPGGGNQGSTGNGSEATITLNLDLQATDEAYNATETAVAR
jgi:hypothetical protein